MTLAELEHRIAPILEEAGGGLSIEIDNDGQVVIYTDLMTDDNELVPFWVEHNVDDVALDY